MTDFIFFIFIYLVIFNFLLNFFLVTLLKIYLHKLFFFKVVECEVELDDNWFYPSTIFSFYNNSCL